MVSSELPEVMGMSDRIIVMRSGRMVEMLDNTNLTADRVVRLAIGAEEVAA
jgi:rhamnose transport system ATP-binding protein